MSDGNGSPQNGVNGSPTGAETTDFGAKFQSLLQKFDAMGVEKIDPQLKADLEQIARNVRDDNKTETASDLRVVGLRALDFLMSSQVRGPVDAAVRDTFMRNFYAFGDLFKLGRAKHGVIDALRTKEAELARSLGDRPRRDVFLDLQRDEVSNVMNAAVAGAVKPPTVPPEIPPPPSISGQQPSSPGQAQQASGLGFMPVGAQYQPVIPQLVNAVGAPSPLIQDAQEQPDRSPSPIASENTDVVVRPRRSRKGLWFVVGAGALAVLGATFGGGVVVGRHTKNAPTEVEKKNDPKLAPPDAPNKTDKQDKTDAEDKTADIEIDEGTHTYESGKAGRKDAFSGKARQVEGGADGMAWSVMVHDAEWYQTRAEIAKVVLEAAKQPGRLEKNGTAAFVEANKEILERLASQTEFRGFKFKQNFEYRYDPKKIFGAKGVYNFLIAFDRIKAEYGGDANKLLKDDAELKVTLATQIGAEHRFSMVHRSPAAKKVAPVKGPTQQKDDKEIKNGAPQVPQGASSGPHSFNLHSDPAHSDFTPAWERWIEDQASQIKAREAARAEKVAAAKAVAKVAAQRAAQEAKAAEAQKIEGINNLALDIEASYQHDQAVQQKVASDYQVTQQVNTFVRDQDLQQMHFENARRSRGFFDKIAAAGRELWSGVTPEQSAQGLQGTGGLRGLFMSSKKRMEILAQNEEILWKNAVAAQQAAAAQGAVQQVQQPQQARAPRQTSPGRYQYVQEDVQTAPMQFIAQRKHAQQKLAAKEKAA